MLFNSYGFIFFFLPVTFVVFFAIGARHRLLAAAWLTAASLFFYGWWNPKYVVLLSASIVFNYATGRLLAAHQAPAQAAVRKHLLAAGVAANLLLLGYFKYANFLLDTLNAAAGTGLSLGEIILPLGISFFTFTQIAFLVDTCRGEVKEYNFVHYALFVTYFPHLIAGPVLHHKEMMPQFGEPSTYRIDARNLAVGLAIFSVGLFKKTVLADGIAPYATQVFSATARGDAPTLFTAWGGVLAYSVQLYYDFSGYSDMAIGLSRLFGIVLPLNFFSPYRAVNIIDFWRRWHMTLSRFLRDYLYFPLGGNRHGRMRRYVNLMVTMLLGGLWHGAGWTFIVWGGLHGLYLVINHAWRVLRSRVLGHDLSRSTGWGRLAARTITLLAVVVGWVFFRAQDFPTAVSLLKGMSGMNGATLPVEILRVAGPLGAFAESLGITAQPGGASKFALTWIWVAVLWAIALLAPNVAQWMGRENPALDYAAVSGAPAPGAQARAAATAYLLWSPSAGWAAAVALLTACSVLSLTHVSEFLYFQF